jgi:hypothetical protein
MLLAKGTDNDMAVVKHPENDSSTSQMQHA